jgi:osmotically-inducible protein OsmY
MRQTDHEKKQTRAEMKIKTKINLASKINVNTYEDIVYYTGNTEKSGLQKQIHEVFKKKGPNALRGRKREDSGETQR